MRKTSLITHQQYQYEHHYRSADDEYGFPDRKIVDGDVCKGKRILSIGSGTGNDLWYLVDGNLVCGLDYALNGLKVGRRHGIYGVVSDLNESPVLPFANNSFDIVVCKDILEYIMEPIVVLRDVHRVLKDEGYVIINVPNHFYFPLRLRLLLGKGLIWKSIGSDHSKDYDEWNYMHIRFFTYKGFQRFFNFVWLSS